MKVFDKSCILVHNFIRKDMFPTPYPIHLFDCQIGHKCTLSKHQNVIFQNSKIFQMTFSLV